MTMCVGYQVDISYAAWIVNMIALQPFQDVQALSGILNSSNVKSTEGDGGRVIHDDIP